MYRNLGQKLMVIAQVFRWVLFAVLEAAGVVFLVTCPMGAELAGAAVMVLAPLAAWLLSLGLYTLGHLVENSDIRTDLAARQLAYMAASEAQAKQAYAQGYAQAPEQPRQDDPYYGG